MPVERLADPEGLRDTPDGPIKRPIDAAEIERCATERARFLAGIRGATLRAEVFSPTIIANLSLGAVGLMLEMILNGHVEVKDAKQAIDVAKIALAISDKVTESVPAGATETVGAESRADKIAAIETLYGTLRERAHDAIDRYAAGGGEAAFDPDEWELDDDDHPRPRLRSVRSA